MPAKICLCCLSKIPLLRHNPSEANGPCYLAVKDDEKNFQEAESYCSSLGGHLASSLTLSMTLIRVIWTQSTLTHVILIQVRILTSAAFSRANYTGGLGPNVLMTQLALPMTGNILISNGKGMDFGALTRPFHVNKSQFEFSAGPGQTAARGLTKTG